MSKNDILIILRNRVWKSTNSGGEEIYFKEINNKEINLISIDLLPTYLITYDYEPIFHNCNLIKRMYHNTYFDNVGLEETKIRIDDFLDKIVKLKTFL